MKIDLLHAALCRAIEEVFTSGHGLVDAPVFEREAFFDAVNRIATPHTGRGRRVGIDEIKPSLSENTILPCLSRTHGLGNFPFHTDGAHWLTPPKIMVLGCLVDEQKRDTFLVPAEFLLKNLPSSVSPQHALFLVQGGRTCFYTNPVSGQNDHFRYDAACMRPANAQGKLFAELVISACSVPTVTIEWVPGRILAVDNQRMLHGRDFAKSSGDRLLLRALFTPQISSYASF